MTASFISRFLNISIVGGFITLAAAPASAAAIVSASADSGPESASTTIPAGLANEKHLSANAKATATTSHANVVAGPLPSCGAAGCVVLGNAPEAGAYASANGNTGTLKVGAQAWDGSSARATARASLTDRITLASPIIKVSVDINALGPSSIIGPGQTFGDTNIFFTMFIPKPEGAPSDVQDKILFSFEVSKDENGSFYTAYLLDDADNPFDTANSMPATLNFSIDLSDTAFNGLIPAGPLDLGFALRASADCDTDNCFSQARADESLYIELQGSSANGYSYLGRGTGTDPDPDPTGIPEPMSALLFLSGLAGLAAARRMGR